MNKSDYFKNKFSVGLCLKEPFDDICAFVQKNKQWLNSVYFSLPLGERFFSRESLAHEYNNNEEKLLSVLEVISSLGIRREMAINTWNLSDQEIMHAIEYCRLLNIIPEEVVCLREYGAAFRKAFPDSEIKYSVNNPESDGHRITETFDTLVAGKGLLRDMNTRHRYIEDGYNLTLLLNNGCLSICNTNCESVHCHRMFDSEIIRHGIDYIYALCSFFPSELRTMIECDKYANQYKYKISNRPLGLKYTQQVLDAYLSLTDDYQSMRSDYRNLAMFCTVQPLAIKLQNVNLEAVCQIKKTWKTELENGIYR